MLTRSAKLPIGSFTYRKEYDPMTLSVPHHGDAPDDDDRGVEQVLQHCMVAIEAMLRANGIVNEDGSTWAAMLAIWPKGKQTVDHIVRGATSIEAATQLGIIATDLLLK
jgi:hypothetical protein